MVDEVNSAMVDSLLRLVVSLLNENVVRGGRQVKFIGSRPRSLLKIWYARSALIKCAEKSRSGSHGKRR
jgi:hypothetical protein